MRKCGHRPIKTTMTGATMPHNPLNCQVFQFACPRALSLNVRLVPGPGSLVLGQHIANGVSPSPAIKHLMKMLKGSNRRARELRQSTVCRNNNSGNSGDNRAIVSKTGTKCTKKITENTQNQQGKYQQRNATEI